MQKTYGTIHCVIGNTPLVEIRRLNPHSGVRIFAKPEHFNPGGSVRDRGLREEKRMLRKQGRRTDSGKLSGIGIEIFAAPIGDTSFESKG
ncbi:MAG: pyridoxal-phosphate dependent enzyme [Syntrophales bacterium]